MNIWNGKHVLFKIIDNSIKSSPELLIEDHPPRSRRRYCDQEHEQGEARLMEYYFVDNPTYDQATFRRRFCMTTITANGLYFQQRHEPQVDKVFHHYRNVRQLCGSWRMGHQQMHKKVSFHVSVKSILEGQMKLIWKDYFMWGEERGFPNMIGSIDCIHWKWKIVPLLGLDNMQVEAVNQQSFWMRLHHMTYRYGMHSLEDQVRAMTLTSSVGLLFLIMS
uniref:Uncharacterized protein n=1 Tax=Lactuca sativa TaxID=4236 RepID=A0A9R1UDH9_LACSA|nr:hypothetical protein LSAT_V11C900492420 [Lactuca sativa]